MRKTSLGQGQGPGQGQVRAWKLGQGKGKGKGRYKRVHECACTYVPVQMYAHPASTLNIAYLLTHGVLCNGSVQQSRWSPVITTELRLALA